MRLSVAYSASASLALMLLGTPSPLSIPGTTNLLAGLASPPFAEAKLNDEYHLTRDDKKRQNLHVNNENENWGFNLHYFNSPFVISGDGGSGDVAAAAAASQEDLAEIKAKGGDMVDPSVPDPDSHSDSYFAAKEYQAEIKANGVDKKDSTDTDADTDNDSDTEFSTKKDLDVTGSKTAANHHLDSDASSGIVVMGVDSLMEDVAEGFGGEEMKKDLNIAGSNLHGGFMMGDPLGKDMSRGLGAASSIAKKVAKEMGKSLIKSTFSHFFVGPLLETIWPDPSEPSPWQQVKDQVVEVARAEDYKLWKVGLNSLFNLLDEQLENFQDPTMLLKRDYLQDALGYCDQIQSKLNMFDNGPNDVIGLDGDELELAEYLSLRNIELNALFALLHISLLRDRYENGLTYSSSSSVESSIKEADWRSHLKNHAEEYDNYFTWVRSKWYLWRLYLTEGWQDSGSSDQCLVDKLGELDNYCYDYETRELVHGNWWAPKFKRDRDLTLAPVENGALLIATGLLDYHDLSPPPPPRTLYYGVEYFIKNQYPWSMYLTCSSHGNPSLIEGVDIRQNLDEHFSDMKPIWTILSVDGKASFGDPVLYGDEVLIKNQFNNKILRRYNTPSFTEVGDKARIDNGSARWIFSPALDFLSGWSYMKGEPVRRDLPIVIENMYSSNDRKVLERWNGLKLTEIDHSAISWATKKGQIQWTMETKEHCTKTCSGCECWRQPGDTCGSGITGECYDGKNGACVNGKCTYRCNVHANKFWNDFIGDCEYVSNGVYPSSGGAGGENAEEMCTDINGPDDREERSGDIQYGESQVSIAKYGYRYGWTSWCGWKGCRVVAWDFTKNSFAVTHGGCYVTSFVIESPASNSAGCVKYNDEVRIRYKDGSTANVHADYDNQAVEMVRTSGTSFYLRPPPSQLSEKGGECIQYGDPVVIAQSHFEYKTNWCGWYGCRVATWEEEVGGGAFQFDQGGSAPSEFMFT